MTKKRSPISLVELHRHERPKPVFFSSEILGFQWTSSINPPHGSAAVALALPVSKFDLAMPGDWIVVRNIRGRTVFFGYVTSVSDGISIGNNNAVVSDAVTVQAETWLDMLSRVELLAPPVNTYPESIGTLFTLQDYARLIEGSLVDLTFGNLGEAVQSIFRWIARVRLPESLGGGTLGDLIPVSYDKNTSSNYTPDLVVEELPTAGAMPTHVGFTSVRSNVYPMLRTLFVPEPALIEMFPHLSPPLEEVPDVYVDEILDRGESWNIRGEPNIDTGTDDNVYTVDQMPPELAGTAGATRKQSMVLERTDLTTYLKARPVLVYRVKPWRTRPLRQSLFAAVDEERRYRSVEELVDTKNPEDPLSGDWAQQQILQNTFEKITWDKKLFAFIPAGRVVAIQRTRSDNDRVNCTFMNLSVVTPQIFDRAGLPVKITDEIRKHGLRTSNPTWPFLITPDDPVKQQNFISYMRTIAAQIMQFYHRGHAFGSGTVSVAGGADIAGLDYDEERKEFKWPVQAGRPFQISLPGKDFSAYAESVTVQIEVRGTTVVGSTTVQYSRGLYGEDEDTFRDSLIPLTNAQFGMIQTSKSKALARQLTTGGGQPDPFANCTSGRPATDPTFSLSKLTDGSPATDPFDPYYKPAWLKTWVLSRCDSRVAATMTDYFDGASGNNVAQPASPGMIPLYYKDMVWFTAAAAYVIERYWRIAYPEATVRITSWFRNETRHIFSGAIDISVRKNIWSLAWYQNGSQKGSIRVDKADPQDTIQQQAQTIPPGVARTITVGSDPTNNIVISGSGISPQHLRLSYKNNVVQVFDVSTTIGGSGTFLRGKKVLPDGNYEGGGPATIGRGSNDQITFGDAAIQFYINTDMLPALQTWAGFHAIANAARIPRGGRGLYLHVNPWNGIQGTHPSEAGSSSSTASGPGGSASPHYDLRGAFGYVDRPTQWVQCDWTGDGVDEIALGDASWIRTGKTEPSGVPLSSLDDIYKNIADPDKSLFASFTAGSLVLGKSIPQVIVDMYVKTPKGDGAVPRKDFSAAQEAARVPVRDAIKKYFSKIVAAQTDAGVRQADPTLHLVDNSVPNIRQVLGYEQSCFYEFQAPGQSSSLSAPTTPQTPLVNP
jgi:hypothetical protein